MIVQAIQIGNFHPLLVHLPIGIILLVFVLEIYNHFFAKSSNNETILFALGCAAVSAIASLGTGWLLGEEGGFDEDLLFLHRWMAVAFTITTIILFFLKRSASPNSKKFYFPFLIASIILVALTGHYGGTMTHGEDYLFKEAANNKIVITNVAEANVYSDIIQPIFDDKCVSCHNQKKMKGGLLMTNSNDFIVGGDSGSIFDTIDGKSLLFHRLHLPMADEDHMPPKGKVQLTAEEIELINWWLENENCFDCKTKTLKTSEKMSVILASLEEDSSPYAIITKKVESVPVEWLEKMNASGVTIYTISEGNPLLIASLFGEQKQLKEKLNSLEEYAENVVELNLGNSSFNDTIAQLISPFENLTKLQLQHTAITDKSINVLEKFKFLESLNLYGTAIGTSIFEFTEKVPSLKSLYLYQTNVTNAELEKFQAVYPDISIQQVPKDAFKAGALEPPTIIAETVFFKDSLNIAFENIFEESTIYYTLDGTLPDSTSLKYNAPFKISESKTVQAIVMKKGWKPSEISTQKFKTASVDYANIQLNNTPHEKYKGQGGKTLTDLKRGSKNFVDGAWLGYEGSHFSTTLTLNEETEISSVSVGALSAPASWIFFPVKLNIYTSDNGNQFKRVKSMPLPKEVPNNEVTQTFFDVKIPPTKAKYVKVEIKSPLKNPSWHPNPGGKSWIFIDEIILN